MKRIALIIAYDGTAYCGFQIQKNAVTIEQVLNESLSKLLNEEVHIIGASRTDSGVHALGNVAVFDTATRIPADKIAFAVNQFLPDDIRIQRSYEVELDFHPRHQNCRKTYEYRILNTKISVPSFRHNTYFFHRPINTVKMKEAAAFLLGEHDFASYCSAHAQVKDTFRIIYSIDIRRDGDIIILRITGNGFLYNMVRIITGTLIWVGIGNIEPYRVKEILDAKDRTKAGPCVPSVGLTLISIEYEKLADQLFVQNDTFMYSLWQKEIDSKKKAYLTVFYCDEDQLTALISRLTLKSFRYGTRRFYVRHDQQLELPDLCAPSKNNHFNEKEFFTAGDYRYTLYGDVWQMDRDLRANPSSINDTIVDLINKSDDMEDEFLKIYQRCFYTAACSITIDRDSMKKMREQGTFTFSMISVDGENIGVLILVEQDEALEIAALGINGNRRRKGYAKAVIEQVAAIAMEKQKKRLTLNVFEKNTKAVSLYISEWFYRIRTVERWYETVDTKYNKKAK